MSNITPIKDRHGFFRRPDGAGRDRTGDLEQAAKQAVVALHPRHTEEILRFAAEGGAARARQAALRAKNARRAQDDPAPKTDTQEKLFAAAKAALVALPRQAQRDEVVAWARKLKIGVRS